MRIRRDKCPRTLCDALLPGPRPPIWGTGPYLLVYLNKGKAPGVECKWPRTLREGLLPGPPIGEMGPYLYLNEHKVPGVWDKWPYTLRDALLPGPPNLGIRSIPVYLDRDRASDVWNKCPRTLPAALLAGSPIWETGPYLH